MDRPVRFREKRLQATAAIIPFIHSFIHQPSTAAWASEGFFPGGGQQWIFSEGVKKTFTGEAKRG